MTKPNSKHPDVGTNSKTVPNTLTNPLLHSSLKNSENLPLSSTIDPTSSTTQKLDQSNDGSDSNTGKSKSKANQDQKENQSNGSYDGKPSE